MFDYEDMYKNNFNVVNPSFISVRLRNKCGSGITVDRPLASCILLDACHGSLTAPKTAQEWEHFVKNFCTGWFIVSLTNSPT